MPKLIEPKVFLIAETTMVSGLENHYPESRYTATKGLQGALNALEAPDWRTDAESDAEHLVEFSGKLCYMSFDTALNKNLTRVGTRKNKEYIQQSIVQQKHGSVLEHACCTFVLVDVSRVFTHELVRHRVGTAFSQVSGRYVRTEVISYWLPKVIRENQEAVKIFNDVFAYIEIAIKRLENLFGIDKMTEPKQFSFKKVLTSAFRRLIGNGQSNHIVFTANHRTLRHLTELRSSVHAEEEIRLVFNQIFLILLLRYPAIYADAEIVEDENGYFEVIYKASKV